MKPSVATLMLCLGTVHAEFLAEYIFSPGWRERLVRELEAAGHRVRLLLGQMGFSRKKLQARF